MSKYPSTDDHTARTVRAAQILKSADAEYFAEIIRDLMSKEQKQRHKPRANKAKRVELAKDGKKIRRGSKAFVNMDNPDILYTEMKW